MKKNILIILLILSNLFFVVYAFIKADEASKSQILANEARAESETLRDEAVMLQQKAQESAAEAMNQMQLAKKALEDCQSK